jgi:peptidoglycan hydrolase-like protein with peptidoglycan-binding domain
MPAGVAMGYFGTLTKAALAKYQAEAGISPAAGYFGPITRAKLNGMVVTVPGTPGTVGNCPTGWTCTGPGTGITTPGVEGTISITQNNSGIASTVYEGDDMVAILGFDVEAKTSDMAVQRIKLDLDEDDGSDTKFYNKIFRKLYVTSGGSTLASIDLNSSTVVKDGANYFITLTGFNLVVPKNTKKQVVIKADVYDSIDSTDYDAENYTISLPAAGSGVRAIDGAGIDQYAGDNSITRTPVVSADLVDSATLSVSLF